MNPIPLYDSRMLEVIEWLLQKGIEPNQIAFCERINYDPSNLHKVKRGMVSFRLAHVANCIDEYGINPAFFFDINAEMFTISLIKKRWGENNRNNYDK